MHKELSSICLTLHLAVYGAQYYFVARLAWLGFHFFHLYLIRSPLNCKKFKQMVSFSG